MPVWLAAMLVVTLLLAQGAGLWHRIAHARGTGLAAAAGSVPGGVAAQRLQAANRLLAGAPADSRPASDRWFGHAAGAHDGADCRWFDHLACGDGLSCAAPLAAFGHALPEALRLAPTGRVPAAPRMAFQARAPPRALGRGGLRTA